MRIRIRNTACRDAPADSGTGKWYPVPVSNIRHNIQFVVKYCIGTVPVPVTSIEKANVVLFIKFKTNYMSQVILIIYFIYLWLNCG
jgi:hypothetical protein